MTIRKSNPGFLTDDELVASFCVRTSEFESIVEMLRECTGSANPHQIVIGPRGSGKTSLLLRVAVEVCRDAGLRSNFFPIVFAEESYEVSTAGEFWLVCLSRLADQVPHKEDAPDLRRTYEDLCTIQDDQTLAERCLGALLDFSDREGKRLVLMVENLNMMFRDMADPDAGWRLRKILQNEPRIILLASATSRFDEIDHPDHALYDLFRILLLHPLDTKECAVLWEAVSGKCPPPETIRSLEILTGGSPRLIAIVARFDAVQSFRELMAELLDLVDDHTEYFKNHIESLPAQERRVYLVLADLWKPATTREIAVRARLETSKCSAQLSRLIERGVVQVMGGTARRKQYYLTERLYNIYYLLRRSRGQDSLIQALIQFMESYYSGTELKDIGAHIAREVGSFSGEIQSLARTALAQMMKSPALAGHREELLATIPEGLMEVFERDSAPSDVESQTLVDVEQYPRRGDQSSEDANEQADFLAAKEIHDKAVALKDQNRLEEALTAYDEVVHRFAESEMPMVSQLVVLALFERGLTLYELDRPEDVLTAYDEVVRRFGDSKTPDILGLVAMALVGKGCILDDLDRLEDALSVFDEVVRRFGDSEMLGILESIALALFGKGCVLDDLDRSEDALVAYDEVVLRFGDSKTPDILELVAQALVRKGGTLGRLDRLEDALATFDEVVRRFGDSEMPVLLESVARVLVRKGLILGRLDRLEDALVAYDEVVLRFGDNETPDILELVAQALVRKGGTLGRLDRLEDALATFDEVVRRFGDSESPAFRLETEYALLIKADFAIECRRYKAAIEAASRVLDICHAELSENRRLAHLIRAKATLASGDQSASERDIEAILTILSDLDSLPKEILEELMTFSIEIGPEHMVELIQASPSANLLLPLTKALEQELGREPRVALEVAEVAEDIRKDLAKLRETQSDGVE